MLLQGYLEQSAARLPDKVYITGGPERVTYRDADVAANRLARALIRSGVERGDRVVIVGENCVEAAIAVWGVLKASAVFVVVNPQTKEDKLRYILRDSGARALVASGRLGPALERAVSGAPELRAAILWGDPREPAASCPHLGGVPTVTWRDALAAELPSAPPCRSIDVDLASLIYTSGSTGEPKGVMMTHANMLAAATSITTYLGAVEDDVVLCALPLSFDYGLYQLIMAARVGARVVLERGFTFVTAVLDTMVRERVTAFPGVPTAFSLIIALWDGRHDLSAVRYVSNTAAALPAAHIDRLRTIFPCAKIFSMYGLTECKRCTYLPPEDLDRKPGSVGIAIPNTELWIEDEEGRRCGPEQVGELVIRGATVMRGYWNKPELTAKKLVPGPIPGEVVLRTGDLCRMDADGYLYFVARMDDIIKSRGEKVAPKEVEDAIYELPGVREVAVVGVPDPILGQAVKAFVVVSDERALDAAAIVAHCRARLEPVMVPKIVELRDSLPKTDSGKIKKTGLI